MGENFTEILNKLAKDTDEIILKKAKIFADVIEINSPVQQKKKK